MKLTETKDGIVLNVFVKPNSPKFQVKIEGDEIIVRSTEEPEKGKVNKEIIKELTKLFHSRVEIISGLTSRQKSLFVAGLNEAEVAVLLKTKTG
jgi:uncharacterized protein